MRNSVAFESYCTVEEAAKNKMSPHGDPCIAMAEGPRRRQVSLKRSSMKCIPTCHIAICHICEDNEVNRWNAMAERYEWVTRGLKKCTSVQIVAGK